MKKQSNAKMKMRNGDDKIDEKKFFRIAAEVDP